MKGNPNDYKKKNPIYNILVYILAGMCLTIGFKAIDKVLPGDPVVVEVRCGEVK